MVKRETASEEKFFSAEKGGGTKGGVSLFFIGNSLTI